MLTNKYGLPDAIMKAITHPHIAYSRGASDVSVTQIIDSPQAAILREAYRSKIEEDVSDRVFALLGTVLHKILEYAGDSDGEIREQRIETTVNGLVVSGGIDVQMVDPANKVVDLLDWKLTSAYNYKSIKQEHVNQLNTYAAIMRRNGWAVRSISNVYIYRDWSKSQTVENNYPPAAIVSIEQELWAPEVAEKYLVDRVKLYNDTLAAFELGEALPRCTDEERWKGKDKYALVNPTSKRTMKVADTREELEEWLKTKSLKVREQPMTVVPRLGPYTRCLSYCGAAEWCPQWIEERGIQPIEDLPEGDGG